MDESFKLILKATRFADARHQGQKRKVSGEDYISHPILVSYMAANLKKSKNIGNIICAAILHDVVEDTKTSYEELLAEFGMPITTLVFELTSDQKQIEIMGKTNYLKKKLVGMTTYAFFIKLCDRLCNLMDNPTEKLISDTQEILKYVMTQRKLTKSHKAVITEIDNVIRTAGIRPAIEYKGLSEKMMNNPETKEALVKFSGPLIKPPKKNRSNTYC